MFLKYSSQPMPILATYNPVGNIVIKAAAICENLGDDFRSHIVEQKDPRFVYAIARAVTADVPNKNHDLFPLDEIKRAYTTFIGRNIFLDHNTKSVRNAVGKIIAAELREDEEGHTYVACLFKVDRELHPDIARKIENGIIDSVSMGANVAEAECSICSCRASREADFCEHLKAPYMYANMYSINHGVEFTELSLVSVPADPTAHMHKVFNMQGGMEKIAVAPAPATDLAPKAGGEEAIEITDVPLEEAVSDNSKAAEKENNTPIIQPDPTSIAGNNRFYQIDCSSNESADLIYNILAPYINKGIEELVITGRGIKVTFEDSVKDVEKFMSECINMFGLLLGKGIVNPVTASLCDDIIHVEAANIIQNTYSIGPVNIKIISSSGNLASTESAKKAFKITFSATSDTGTSIDKVKKFVSLLKDLVVDQLSVSGTLKKDSKMTAIKTKPQFTTVIYGKNAKDAASNAFTALNTVLEDYKDVKNNEEGLEQLITSLENHGTNKKTSELSDSEKETIRALINEPWLSELSLSINDSNDILEQLKNSDDSVWDEFVEVVNAHPEIKSDYAAYKIPPHIVDFLKETLGVRDNAEKKEISDVVTDEKEDKQKTKKINQKFVNQENARKEEPVLSGKGNPALYSQLGDTYRDVKQEEKQQKQTEQENTQDKSVLPQKTKEPGDDIQSQPPVNDGERETLDDWGDAFANTPSAIQVKEIEKLVEEDDDLQAAEQTTKELLSQVETDVKEKQIKEPGKLFALFSRIKPIVAKMSSTVKTYFNSALDAVNAAIAEANTQHIKDLSNQFKYHIKEYYEPSSLDKFREASTFLSMLSPDLYNKMERVHYNYIQQYKQKYGDIPTPSEVEIYKQIFYLGTDTDEGKRFLRSLSHKKQYTKEDFDIAKSYVDSLERLLLERIDSSNMNEEFKPQAKEYVKSYIKNGLRTAKDGVRNEMLDLLSLAGRQYTPVTLDGADAHQKYVEDAIQNLVKYGFDTNKTQDIPDDAIEEAKRILESEYSDILQGSDVADDVINTLKTHGFDALSTSEQEDVSKEVSSEDTPHLYSVFPQIDSVLSELEAPMNQPSADPEEHEQQVKTVDTKEQADKKQETNKQAPAKENKLQKQTDALKQETEDTAKKLGNVERLKNKEYRTRFGIVNIDDVLFDDETIRDLQEKMLSLGEKLSFSELRKNIKAIEKAARIERGIKNFLDTGATPSKDAQHTLTFTGKVRRYNGQTLSYNFDFKCTISKSGASSYDATAEVTGSPDGSTTATATGEPNAGKALELALFNANNQLNESRGTKKEEAPEKDVDNKVETTEDSTKINNNTTTETKQDKPSSAKLKNK